MCDHRPLLCGNWSLWKPLLRSCQYVSLEARARAPVSVWDVRLFSCVSFVCQWTTFVFVWSSAFCVCQVVSLEASFCVPIRLFGSAGKSLCLNCRRQISFTYLFCVPTDFFCVTTGLFCVPIGLFGSLFWVPIGLFGSAGQSLCKRYLASEIETLPAREFQKPGIFYVSLSCTNRSLLCAHQSLLCANRSLWQRGPQSLSRFQKPGIFYVSLLCDHRSLLCANRSLWKRGPEPLSQLQEQGIFYVSLSCANRSLLCDHRPLLCANSSPMGLFCAPMSSFVSQ